MKIKHIAFSILFVLTISCASHSSSNHQNGEERALDEGHARDEGGEGEGEENGTELSLTDTYKEVRNGAHLSLSYDKDSNSFIGVVENRTSETLDRVRVEVHLSNGTELGPTKAVSLAPGEKSIVTLKATRKSFTTWSTHAEVGSNEHQGENGEGHEGKSEHKGEGSEKGGEHGGS